MSKTLTNYILFVNASLYTLYSIRMASASEEPIALIGASIVLPANIHNREKFFEIVRDKNQVSVDTVAARRYHASDIDDTDAGHPWKLKSKYSMVFTEEEVSEQSIVQREVW